MTNPTSDILTRVRALGVSEDEALVLIEQGDSDRLGAIEARDPTLGRMLRAMAGDRMSLASIGDPPMPTERQAAIANALREESPVEPPLSLSELRVVQAPRVTHVLPWGAAGRVGGLLAAGVALAIGLPALVQWFGNRPPSPIAVHSPPRTPDGTQVATGGESAPVTTPGDAEQLATARAPSTSARDARLAAALDGPDWFLDADRAAQLARAGRLAIRVRTLDRASTDERLARITGDRGLHSPAWRVLDDPSPGALAMARASVGTPNADRWSIDPAILASESHAGGVSFDVRSPQPAPSRVLLAEARADAPAIASLRAAVSLGRDERAYFEVLPEAIRLTESGDGASVLWWTEPPERWGVGRVWVPVLVDEVAR